MVILAFGKILIPQRITLKDVNLIVELVGSEPIYPLIGPLLIHILVPPILLPPPKLERDKKEGVLRLIYPYELAGQSIMAPLCVFQAYVPATGVSIINL
jgi:hypothetical protein